MGNNPVSISSLAIDYILGGSPLLFLIRCAPMRRGELQTRKCRNSGFRKSPNGNADSEIIFNTIFIQKGKRPLGAYFFAVLAPNELSFCQIYTGAITTQDTLTQ